MSYFKKEDVRELVDSLTNFYRNNLPVDSALVGVLEVMAETSKFAYDMAMEGKDAFDITKAKPITTLPYLKLPIGGAIYSEQVANMLLTLDPDQQISYLDKEGLFVEFAVTGQSRYFTVEDRVVQYTKPTLLAATLRPRFASPEEETFSVQEDYVIRSNRLYLLPDFILNQSSTLRFLHAFDVKVNYGVLQELWGSLYDVNPGPLLTTEEYRATLEAFERVDRSKNLIKDIMESIQLATGWDEFKIEDACTPSLEVGKRRLYDDMYLSPNTFIVTLPERLSKDKVRLNIAITLVDQSKEPQTNFIVLFDVVRTETLTPEEETLASARVPKLDVMKPEMAFKRSQSIRRTEVLFYYGHYDTVEYYDLSGRLVGTFYDEGTGDIKSNIGLGTEVDILSRLLDIEEPVKRMKNGQYDWDALLTRLQDLSTLLDIFDPVIETTDIDEYASAQYRLQAIMELLEEDGVLRRFYTVRKLTNDPFTLKQKRGAVDGMAASSKHVAPKQIRKQTETLYMNNTELYRYDMSANFDRRSIEYDYDQGEDGTVEIIQVTKLSFPEIPRQFAGQINGSAVNLGVRGNTDGTTNFELLAANANEAFAVIETKANVPGSRVVFNTNVKSFGKRYYKVRATAGSNRSLPTLAIDASLL